MKKYYEVVAKCGHVGKGKYYEGVFYEIAEDGKKAAEIVRGRGRVKHHKKDAIISVKKISYEEYLVGIENKEKDLYFQCLNIQDQNVILDQIAYNIKNECWLSLEIDTEKRREIIKYKKTKQQQKIKSYNKYIMKEYLVS